MVGTPYYIAPEVLEGKYDEKCDVWSVGVITFIILCGCPPFGGQSDKIIYEAIKKGEVHFRQEAWSNISSEAKDFIKHLLITEPMKRPNAEEALKHDWLNT